MEDLKKQGMTGLVLDVRNNGGGSLEAVTKMLDELLPGRRAFDGKIQK